MDTGALIAFFNPNDKNHEKAVKFFELRVSMGAKFIIERPVLMEFQWGIEEGGKKDCFGT